MSEKAEQLRRLALKRRSAEWPGYRHLREFHGGAYECEYVSPYTKSADNVDAAIFILLQDWISEDRLAGPLIPEAIELGQIPSLPTNKNLSELLRRFYGLSLADTYATNLFPFIKPGGMSAPIPRSHLVRAARDYALPQIRIVRPRLVVCLGLNTFRAIQGATKERVATSLAAALSAPLEYQGASVWCQAHTGALGQANRNRGGVNRVHEDWATMRQSFERAG